MPDRPSILKVISIIVGVIVVSALIVVVGTNILGGFFYKPAQSEPTGKLAVQANDSAFFSLPLGERQLPGRQIAIAVIGSGIVVDTVGIAGPERAGTGDSNATVVLLRRVPGHDTTVNGVHALLFEAPAWFPTLRNLLGSGLSNSIVQSAKARLLVRYHIATADTTPRTNVAPHADTTLHADTTGKASDTSPTAPVARPAASRVGKTAALSIEFGNPCWAFTWGVMANIIALTLVWGMFVTSEKTREEWPPNTTGKLLKHMAWFPMRLTLTPSGTYSLAALQMLIWTVVVCFGLNYVWKMTEGWLEISEQVLLLLGIGGGTAVLKRIAYNARLQNIPADQQYLVTQAAGESPSLFDLVSEDNTPNIAKVQMLLFTVLVAGIVVRYICTDYIFPVLPDGLVALLGLSSAVFVGATTVSGVTADQVKQEGEKLRDISGEVPSPVDRAPAPTSQQRPEAAEEAYRKLLRRYLNV